MIWVALFVVVWFALNAAALAFAYRADRRTQRRLTVLERVQRPERSYLERRRIARSHRDRESV